MNKSMIKSTIKDNVNYKNLLVGNTADSALPVNLNLYAWYDSTTFSGSTWSDKTINARNASVTAGSASVVSSTVGNGSTKTFNVVQGNTSTKITFPTSVLPATFTLFHVTRWNGVTKRIITDATGSNNWLSGHWGDLSGVSYHNGWLTQTTSSIHGSNWVLSTDQNSMYRSNKTDRTVGTPGSPSYAQLGINTWTTSESSDFQIAEIIVYDRTLNSTEYTAVENYLATKYGL